MSFDPSALQGLGASFDEDYDDRSAIDDDQWLIAGAEIRRRWGALKLAARIVGIATAIASELDDQTMLLTMSNLMQRLTALRETFLTYLGVTREAPQFGEIFNRVTDVTLDVLTEEWKWSRIAPATARLLPPSAIANLLQAIARCQPERFDPVSAGSNVAIGRRLCVLEAIAKLHSASNYFDWYQSNPSGMVERLLHAVVRQAELQARDVSGSDAISPRLLQRLYAVSTALMCEVFKSVALHEVLRLQALPELDRALVIAQYERLGGMNYDHVIDRHRAAMERMVETMNVILEAS